MQTLIQNKILLAILAAVLAIGGYAFHIHQNSLRSAAAAEQSVAILRHQQADADAAKKHDAETWKFVHDQRQKHESSSVNGSKTWTTYVP